MTLSPAAYRALADAVVVFHFGFVLFVVLGGSLVVRWRRAAWIHLPCAAWGAAIEFGGRICPLTPLEHHLRALGNQATYGETFVEHYITHVLYPAGLTRGLQFALGALVIAINLTFYAIAFSRRQRAAPFAA